MEYDPLYYHTGNVVSGSLLKVFGQEKFKTYSVVIIGYNSLRESFNFQLSTVFDVLVLMVLSVVYTAHDEHHGQN